MGINESDESDGSSERPTPKAADVINVFSKSAVKIMADAPIEYPFIILQQKIRVKKTESIQNVKDRVGRGLKLAIERLDGVLQNLREDGSIHFTIKKEILAISQNK